MTLNRCTDNPLVEILMATYNGSNFLVEQIESIRYQSYTNWRLLIRDDGSHDDTLAIAEYYQKIDPRITIQPSSDNSHNASKNFLNLLQHSQADYIMFSDQDDLWLPDKIELELDAIMSHEFHLEDNIPLLVFTDSAIVDENLNLINASCSSEKPYDSNMITFEQLLFNNVGQGCTMMLNRSLANLICSNSMDPLFKMHDYWAIILAAFFGQMIYIPQVTLLYRQHSNNVYGVNYRDQSATSGLLHLLHNPNIIKGWLTRLSESEKDFITRAESFSTSIKDINNLVSPHVDSLRVLCSFRELSLLRKILYIQKYHLLRNQRGLYAQLCQLIGLLL